MIVGLGRTEPNSCYGTRLYYLAKALGIPAFPVAEWQMIPASAHVIIVGGPSVYEDILPALRRRQRGKIIVAETGGMAFWERPERVELRKNIDALFSALQWGGESEREAKKHDLPWFHTPFGCAWRELPENAKRKTPPVILVEEFSKGSRKDPELVRAAIEIYRKRGFDCIVRSWEKAPWVDEHATRAHFPLYATSFDGVSVYAATWTDVADVWAKASRAHSITMGVWVPFRTLVPAHQLCPVGTGCCTDVRRGIPPSGILRRFHNAPERQWVPRTRMRNRRH